MNEQPVMYWCDDRWGRKGRGIYIAFGLPVLLYILYFLAIDIYSAKELTFKLLSAIAFVLVAYAVVSSSHGFLVNMRTLQRAEYDGAGWNVALYFGKYLRFSNAEVVCIELFEKRSPKFWPTPLSVDKNKPNYIVLLATGDKFYISGVLPNSSALVAALSKRGLGCAISAKSGKAGIRSS